VRRAARRGALTEQGRRLLRDRLGVGRELAPRDADDAPTVDDQGAVLLERLACPVRGEALAVDDQPLLWPAGVELAMTA
jgi:hypothetical protein